MIEAEDSKPFGVFDDVKDAMGNPLRMFDFEEIRKKIIELTDQVAGVKKQIVDNPIILSVTSPSCPDLTLVDLPGMTKISVDGQQEDIERVTREMAERYCKEEKTIILAVIAANQDLANSEALQLARKLDKHGKRTIGCLTKIDIMDRGTSAKKMVLGQEIPLRLGYVGVKGRSNQDIKDKIKVAKGLELEKQYFETHPEYSRLPPGYMGTAALVSKLTKVFFSHIQALLPEISKEVLAKISEADNRLKELGPALPSNEREKIQQLWTMISTFTDNYKNSIRGKFDPNAPLAKGSKKEKAGGVEIKLTFEKMYDEIDLPITKAYKNKDIQDAIMMHQGDSIPGFPSIDAFIFLIHPMLEKLKRPALEAINDVFLFLDKTAQKLITKIFNKYPSVMAEMSEVVTTQLRIDQDKTQKLVEMIIQAQESYLFTNDQDYILNRTSFLPGKSEDEKKSEQDAQKKKFLKAEELFIEELRSRIDSYFAIVLRNIKDTVPKTVGYFLVKKSMENMHFALYDKLTSNKEVLDSVGEAEVIVRERKELTERINTLKKSLNILRRDPE